MIYAKMMFLAIDFVGIETSTVATVSPMLTDCVIKSKYSEYSFK
jgi:hypothetical protein